MLRFSRFHFQPQQQHLSAVASLSKRARLLISNAKFNSDLKNHQLYEKQALMKTYNKKDDSSSSNNHENKEKDGESSSSLTPRQKRQREWKDQLLRDQKEQLQQPQQQTINNNSLLKWKHNNKNKNSSSASSSVRVETQQMIADRKLNRSKQEFQKEIELELDRTLIIRKLTDSSSSSSSAVSSSSSDSDDGHHVAISDLVILLNALRFFDSDRADIAVKLFSMVASELEKEHDEFVKFVANSSSSTTNDDQVIQTIIPKKIEFTKACNAASFALHTCAKSGIVVAEDMDRVLHLIMNSLRKREMFIDAGCLTRCVCSIMILMNNNDHHDDKIITRRSSSSSNPTSNNDNNNDNNHNNNERILHDFLRFLGKVRLTKFHDGSIKSSLAMDFLHALTVCPRIKTILMRTRSAHLIEHFCFIVAGRSNRADIIRNKNINNNDGRRIPRIISSRIPHPEQLQRTQKILAKLGLFYSWLDQQLVQEGSMIHGVVANGGEPADELERIHQEENHQLLDSLSDKRFHEDDETHGDILDEKRTKDLRALRDLQNNGNRKNDNNNSNNPRLYPKSYPILDYVSAFGDDRSPEPPVAGKFYQRNSSNFEDDDPTESDLARRIRRDKGFNIKTDMDWNSNDDSSNKV